MLFKIDTILAGICLFAMCIQTQAQKNQFLMDKPGRFIFENKLNKCPGLDIASFTKNLTSITEWVQHNDSIVRTPKGFGAAVSFSGNSCDQLSGTGDYGISGRISFSFRYFYIENGVWGSRYAAPIASLIIEKYLKGRIAPSRQHFEDAMVNSDLISTMKFETGD